MSLVVQSCSLKGHLNAKMPIMESQSIIPILQKCLEMQENQSHLIMPASKCLGVCSSTLHVQNTKNSVSTPVYSTPTDASFSLRICMHFKIFGAKSYRSQEYHFIIPNLQNFGCLPPRQH